MNTIQELKKRIIDNDYCIGCGACSYVSKGIISIKRNDKGQFQALIDQKYAYYNNDILNVCPFYNSEVTEDILGKELFSLAPDIKYDNYQGYYLSNYAGHIQEGQYRVKGSSGGFGSWLASKLLEEGLVDKVIHVKSSNESDMLFEYKISNDIEEIQEGSKSRYYPIEMSKVLEYVREKKYKYLFIGIPCFIKSLRLLQKQDSILKERIILTLGLVCGHLKSDFFAKSLGWELGIKPSDLKDIDFRMKYADQPANRYGVRVTGKVQGNLKVIEAPTKELFVSNWGHGLFKYSACDYCDDVLAETADITIGDAWLREYSKDSGGTNVIIVRNPIIDDLIETFRTEISLDEISANKIYQSQAGGFRHRRDGLKYRLYLKDLNNQWRPRKRVEASDNIPKQRRKIYEMRLRLTEYSYKNYYKAIEEDDYRIFIKNMSGIINEYDKVYRGNIAVYLIKRLIGKVLRILKLR
ncbi:MAG: Coenzyme F420 hydrogenase/dehydrogenase, beta subunit C-terminal domain [Halanaerobiales bacterium]|nr:Coenzyme F420 hydrogenase/dehydrogenase, beta subunit C-terminal domain [Halanaerobiales bacterium]